MDAALTERADSVETVRVLHTVQLHALPMPVLDLAGREALLLGTPRDVVDDAGDEARAAVRDEVEAARRRGALEERAEERVRVRRLCRRDVLLVEHVVQERGELDHEQVGLLVGR